MTFIQTILFAKNMSFTFFSLPLEHVYFDSIWLEIFMHVQHVASLPHRALVKNNFENAFCRKSSRFWQMRYFWTTMAVRIIPLPSWGIFKTSLLRRDEPTLSMPTKHSMNLFVDGFPRPMWKFQYVSSVIVAHCNHWVDNTSLFSHRSVITYFINISCLKTAGFKRNAFRCFWFCYCHSTPFCIHWWKNRSFEVFNDVTIIWNFHCI